MATSLAIILLFGLLVNKVFTKAKMPGLLGMLILGVILGSHMLNLLHPDIIEISSDVRRIALIIILLRAGFGTSREDLNSVGGTTLKLSCIPGLVGGFAIAFACMKFLGFTFVEGAILGFILATVSPAVVVPPMLEFIEKTLVQIKEFLR